MAASALLPAQRRAPEPDLHARLKAATRHAHEVVDAHYSRFDLGSPHGYRDFLSAHAAVLPRCEAILHASGVSTMLLDWDVRRRSDALYADLAATGTSAASGVCAVTPLAAPEAWGMLYVLEGSRLGGAVLAGRVAKNSDPRCRAATAYLRHGHGARLWPIFLLAFAAEPVTNLQFERVIAGALETFSLFAGIG